MELQFEQEDHRIVLYNEEKKIVAEVTWVEGDHSIVNITHTFVDDSLRGQGIAGKLMEEAAIFFRKNHITAQPVCSYAVGWFQKHPEYGDILAQ